jgi:hypothetical protein
MTKILDLPMADPRPWTVRFLAIFKARLFPRPFSSLPCEVPTS